MTCELISLNYKEIERLERAAMALPEKSTFILLDYIKTHYQQAVEEDSQGEVSFFYENLDLNNLKNINAFLSSLVEEKCLQKKETSGEFKIRIRLER